MRRAKHPWQTDVICAIGLFLVAWFLRWIFFQGFVLGDDAYEFYMVREIGRFGPAWKGEVERRFMVWLFNVLVLKFHALDEFGFFLPTYIFSSSFSVLAFGFLRREGYPRWAGIVAGLFVASAPFEIMIGITRMNDLFLSWFLALGFIVLTSLPKTRLGQVCKGVALAFLFWCAFYVKLWAVYILPLYWLYAWFVGRKEKHFEFAFHVFVSVSALLHLATCLFWKVKTGTYLPFVFQHAPNYAFPREHLKALFSEYGYLLLKGSEFGTTFYGVVPYLFLTLLVLKIILACIKGRHAVFDRVDLWLLGYFWIFFLLLTFFPNGFKLDKYYSVYRTFRYTTPLSFPLALMSAKMILDLPRHFSWKASPFLQGLLWGSLLLLNGVQAAEATRPGRTYRSIYMNVVQELYQRRPPMMVMDSWMGGLMFNAFTQRIDPQTVPTFFIRTQVAKDHEKWLKENQSSWPSGTLLLTGLSSYVNYGCHSCGLRLREFEAPLSPDWKLLKEVGYLDFLPKPEATLLWRLERRSKTPPTS